MTALLVPTPQNLLEPIQPIAPFIQGKRSPKTRRAYMSDLELFLKELAFQSPQELLDTRLNRLLLIVTSSSKVVRALQRLLGSYQRCVHSFLTIACSDCRDFIKSTDIEYHYVYASPADFEELGWHPKTDVDRYKRFLREVFAPSSND